MKYSSSSPAVRQRNPRRSVTLAHVYLGLAVLMLIVMCLRLVAYGMGVIV
jgi:hypothetical protein